MSGQQIGTVVGGIIGAYFGAPQLGAAIGGMIGGAVDPTKVYGPRLSDAQNQTAMDGVPMAYGYGTFPCKGNVIWRDPTVKEHEHKNDGKGSGQEQTAYTYTRSYAIGVCKGPISGYKIIKRNGKIVFDARTDAELSALGYTAEQIAESRAAQAKFLQKCTLYYGTADQTPDPTMVAVKGVGNVPAYAGTAGIVLTDDETMQGEVAQYEFVVANCGERDDGDPPGRILITGFDDGAFVVSDAVGYPDLSVLPSGSGASLAGSACAVSGDGVWLAFSGAGMRYSTDNMTTWESASAARTSRGRFAVNGAGGWLIQHYNSLAKSSHIPTDASEFTIQMTGYSQSSAMMNVNTGGRFISSQRFSEGTMFMSTPSLDASPWSRTVTNDSAARPVPGGGFIRLIADMVQVGSALYCCCGVYGGSGGISPFGGDIRRSDDEGATWPTLLKRTSTGDFGNTTADRLAVGNGHVLALSRNSSVCYTSADNWAAGHSTGLTFPSPGQDWQLDQHGRRIVFVGGWFFIIGQSGMVTTQDGITFSAVIPYPGGRNGPQSIAGRTEAGSGIPIPDAPGYFINPSTGAITGPIGTQIDPCQPTLGEIVSRQCAKRISTDVIDVSELTDLVTGFRVAAPSSPQKNIQALQPGYFFDGSEFDGKLHFPKRGGPDSFALTVDDLCERDGDLIQWETKQEPELLRKVTVGYLDPDTTYTATTQQWERRSGTVKAEGEGVLEFPVVETKDWAAQAAHKSVKVGWAEADKCTFHVSIARADLVTAAVGTITDEAGTVHRVRIERIEDEGLRRMVEARRTRADVYESTVDGAAKPLPLFPGSNIRGPTDGLLLNLPVMVDSSDVPGIAWAASGYLSGWVGGTLQFQRAGQWVDAGTVTLPATMGTLLDPLPAHAGDVDNTNTLHLRMNGDLESVTFTNLLQERNPLAILYDDGTAEIVQFQTATEVAAGEYELTTLLRGRMNTVAGDHAAGARAVFLDSDVHYATLQPTDVGTTLTYRFVSNGTDPDAAPVQTLDLTTMESQREWPVFDLAVEQDGDDYTVTWRKRDRLGTDVFPIRSANWRGYEVSWSYGGNTHTETVLTESVTFNLPGATDITFSVAQLNLYTGAGPAKTVNIP